MTLRILLLVLLASPSLLSAQEARAVVEFDHATDRARLITTRGGRADTTELGETRVVRVPHSVPVEVRVVNTNTAVYRYATVSRAAALPETEMVQSFMGRLGPYVPELRTAALRGLRGRGAADARALAEARSEARASMSIARDGLLRLDRTLYGRGGLQDATTSALFALERMRRGEAPEIASEPLRRTFELGPACGGTDPVRLPAANDLLESLSALVDASDQVQLSIRDLAMLGEEPGSALRDSAQSVLGRVQDALTDFEPLVARAYRAEHLVGLVAGACSHWNADTVRVSRTRGRTVEVRVEPRAEPEVARIAQHGPRTYTVEVQPHTFLRPAIGLTAVAAPGARFDRFATREVEGGLEVYRSGQKDARFGVGATLGFTWPLLDQRDAHGVAVWLPELVVTTGGTTGFGIGSAVSWSFLKVGAGALWARHSVLDRVRVGDVLAPDSELPLTIEYGPPSLYISISVFDWAPFVDRLDLD